MAQPPIITLNLTVCCNRGKIRKELKRQIKELEEFNSFTCYSKQDDSIKATEEVRKQQQEEQKLFEEQTKVLHTFRDDNKTVSVQNVSSYKNYFWDIGNGNASRTTQG